MAEIKPIVIPLHLKRSVRGIMLQHLLAGIALLMTVLEFLSEHENPHYAILIIEGIIAICLVIAIIFEFRHVQKGHLPQSLLVDILAAGVIACEATNKFLEHRTRLAIAWWFVSIITLVIGYLKPRFRGRRYIAITPEEIKLKLWLFKSQTISNGSILSVMKMPARLEINLKSGESWAIDLKPMLNAHEFTASFFDACKESGIPKDKLIGFTE
jgi:hypothetical protein